MANPDLSISNLPLLTEAEQHQLLVEWNKSEVELDSQPFFHKVVEAQAERTPDAVAVAFEDECLTYGELNSRANRLAHHLQANTVGPEVLVGICMERSFELLVGILGVFKAGGACVLMDPANPKDRLAFMFADAQVSVVLTQKRLSKERSMQIPTSTCRPTLSGQRCS